MVSPSTAFLAAALSAALAAPTTAGAAGPETPALRIAVDATDLTRRIFRVQQTLPVQPGPLRLLFPRWLPGNHAPTGDVARLAGLVIRADDAQGAALDWLRDPLDTHAFQLTVPPGVRQLALSFEHLSPTERDSGRVVVTPLMLNLQWNNVLLYPAGPRVTDIPVQATLKLPDGWQYGTALRAERSGAEGVRFATVSLEQLVDSPVFAGRHFRRIALEPEGAGRPVVLNLVGDSDEVLKPGEAQIEAHRQLVVQADRLFGARHFQHYDFLLAFSEQLGGIGLEHHQSSENGVGLRYWQAWDKSTGGRELLPHEYAHSWNGKFRRPADLLTPDFNVPMRNSLLWLYEGQTEFWGRVLATRSGLVSAEIARDNLAQIAASLDQRSGRRWRNLQDTTQDAIMANRRERRDWHDWQRSSGDYYIEGTLIYLDADSLIREKTGGQKSLDDFARAFFGLQDGALGPLPYTFDDIVATLDTVVPHDWAGFLRQRLDGHGPGAPLDGLQRAGWRLVFTETQSENQKAAEQRGSAGMANTDLSHSLGLSVGREGKLGSVRWEGPAFNAGLAPGTTLVAVNQMAYTAERLKAAITANKDGRAPIELLVRDADQFRTVRIDWRGGLRYPALARIEGSEDRLTPLLSPR